LLDLALVLLPIPAKLPARNPLSLRA
jgi:hypothetical protein